MGLQVLLEGGGVSWKLKINSNYVPAAAFAIVIYSALAIEVAAVIAVVVTVVIIAVIADVVAVLITVLI